MVDYTLSDTADVVFDLAQGRKACQACARRWAIVMSFGATGEAGSNHAALPFPPAQSGRLSPGANRLIATPINGSNTQGGPVTAPLRIAGR